MNEQQLVRIDGIKWWVTKTAAGGRTPVPLCPDHDLRMTEYPEGRVEGDYGWHNRWDSQALKLACAEGPHYFPIPREFAKETQYVLDRVDAKIFKGMQVIDLDGELTPIAKEKLKGEDSKHFVTGQLMQSKRGLQLVLYAGEQGSGKKTQIFVEPGVKRVAFDHKDLNPNDVFVEVRATFADGSSHELKRADPAGRALK